MKNKYSSDEKENELFERTHRLMEQRRHEIGGGAKSIYSLKVHEFLQKKPMMHHDVDREIILPMPREKWYPSEQLLSLEENYSEAMLDWPQYSHIQYVMDYTMSNHFAFLCAGYGICGEELIPCTFLANFLPTQKVEGMTDLVPEYWAIDPMSIIADRKIECYIGVIIDRGVAEQFYLDRGQAGHFLENQIILEDKKRLAVYNGTNI